MNGNEAQAELRNDHDATGDHPDGDIVDIGVAMWRRERPEIDCSGKSITGRILRLGELFLDAMNGNMAQFGLRFSQYAIIGTLRAAGPPYRMSPTVLRNTLLVSSGGLSNLLKDLEHGGLIRRITDPADGRGVIVELSDAGLRLSETTMVAQAQLERHLVSGLSPAEQAMLVPLLRRLILLNRRSPEMSF